MKRQVWSKVLTLAAFIFLIAFSIPAFDSDLNERQEFWIEVVQWICWLAFAVDLLLGLIKTEDKKHYLKSHPLEVASVLLPFLRPLRLLRVISLGGLAIQRIAVGKHLAITAKVALTAIFIAYISAIQITVIERPATGSNIKEFGDGLWWAISTVTTVGYGDYFPTTLQGKFLAVLLMITGISLVGAVTASVAAWFVRMSSEDSLDK